MRIRSALLLAMPVAFASADRRFSGKAPMRGVYGAGLASDELQIREGR